MTQVLHTTISSLNSKGTHRNDVLVTSIRRNDVASTSIRHVPAENKLLSGMHTTSTSFRRRRCQLGCDHVVARHVPCKMCRRVLPTLSCFRQTPFSTKCRRRVFRLLITRIDYIHIVLARGHLSGSADRGADISTITLFFQWMSTVIWATSRQAFLSAKLPDIIYSQYWIQTTHFLFTTQSFVLSQKPV